MESQSKTVLCPVCGTGRGLHFEKFPRLKVLGLCVFTTLTLSGLVFVVFGVEHVFWSGILFSAVSFIISEAFYTLKRKSELVCPVCRFDPVLYRRSPEKAKSQCLERLKSQEEFFLRNWNQMTRNSTH